MSNHDIHTESDEKFVPLTDNNSNLSVAKIIFFIVLLGLGVFGLTYGVQFAGSYIGNEEQIEFKHEHGRTIKDSDENKIEVSDEVKDLYKEKYPRVNEDHEGVKKEEVKDENKMDEKKMMEDKKKDESKPEDKKMDDKKDGHNTEGHHHK